jgi:hypothetical protein
MYNLRCFCFVCLCLLLLLIQELAGLTIALMQIGEAALETWASDPNEFVASEEDLDNTFSVRAAGIRLYLIAVL